MPRTSHKWRIFLGHWLRLFSGPVRLQIALRGLPWYFADWRHYSHMAGSEPIRWLETYPRLADRDVTHDGDPQYLFANAWTTRQIVRHKPRIHVDCGSSLEFVFLLSATLPVIYVDYRTVPQAPSGLSSVRGDLMQLPFPDQHLSSVSCIHVIEHIGLGRYGDPLNPLGSANACRELARVLAPGGNLYVGVPVGRERLCFNAHRIFDPARLPELLKPLELLEMAAIADNGSFLPSPDTKELRNAECAFAVYRFTRPMP